jgi:rhodanese-related sulfurtransferase
VAVAALVITAYRRLMHPRPQPLAELCLTDVPVMAIAPVIGKKGRKLNGAYTGYRQALSEVQVITNDELKDYLKKGYTLLDVRPNYERERIRPENSEHVEFIQEVESPWYDVVAFGRKWGNTAYAGCTRDFTRNPEFVPEVIKRFNKNSKLIIACGDGLRSLVACKLLQDEGCRDVVWVEAGLLTCESEPAMKSVGTQVDVGYKRAGLDLGLIWANAVDKFTGTTNKNYS